MGVEGGDERTVHRARSSVADASNVLFLAPSLGEAGEERCLDLFVPSDPTGTRLLGVSYTRTADRWLDLLREHVERPPSDLAVVSVGTTTRSAAAASGDARRANGVVQTVESPDDLTGLGITLGQQLSAWTETSDEPVTVCFDSLTVLLQYVDLQRAFRFLHVLSGRVESMGVNAHYHLDPDAVDEQTVATLTSLFEAVLRYEDGEWQAHRR